MSEENGVQRFKLVRKRKQFEIEDIDGKVRVCTAHELTGAGKGEWDNFSNARYIVNKENGAIIGIKDAKGFEAKLITMCCSDDNTGKPVEEVEILRQWPTTVQDAVYLLCCEVNGFKTRRDLEAEKKAEDPAKKD